MWVIEAWQSLGWIFWAAVILGIIILVGYLLDN
jgi:hypothetical protein